MSKRDVATRAKRVWESAVAKRQKCQEEEAKARLRWHKANEAVTSERVERMAKSWKNDTVKP